jgi:2-methylcitrate dehydratase
MTPSHEGHAGEPTVVTLARAVGAIRTRDIPSAAMRQAQLLLLDTIGCGLAGAHEEVAQAVAEVALATGGKPECPLIGRAQKTDVLGAVLANGAAIRVLDLNDYLIGQSNGQPETGGHPSDNIPVAVAVGAQRGCTGSDILASIVIGYELYARLQRLMDRNGAWDSVTASGIVAPAMAGRLMNLSEERLAHAIALGAARAATPAIVRSGHISAAKSIANALVAQSGVQAALLAMRGITAPLPILDDKRGLRDLFADADLSLLTAPISAISAIAHAHIKAYPCVNTGQSAVAAALQLHAMLKGDTNNLTRVELVMADYAVTKRHQEDEARLRPHSREAADHSFPFLVAVTLLDGAFGLKQFENERWRDPRVNTLMEKIVMRRDQRWNTRSPGAFPCSLRATASDDREWTAEVPYPPGFSKEGLDETTTIEKFHAIAAPVFGHGACDGIVDAVMEFHHSQSTATLDAAIAIEGTFT